MSIIIKYKDRVWEFSPSWDSTYRALLKFNEFLVTRKVSNINDLAMLNRAIVYLKKFNDPDLQKLVKEIETEVSKLVSEFGKREFLR